MIEEARGRIDYAVCGTGPTVVLVPGSCSTGAAWRPVIASWNGQFRCVTTSLLGYGGTVERHTASDPDISHEAEMLETVVRKAGSRVHLVGHSFGGWWRWPWRYEIASPWQASWSWRRRGRSCCGTAVSTSTTEHSAG
jgi:pimeloyl-ACP methyl ester carboxylesterase